jgi:zinc transport system substrate-binding protein
MKKIFLITFFSLLMFLGGAGASQVTAGVELVRQVHQPIPIFVSIGPHLDFCRQIGGNRIRVELLLPPGKNSATFTPSPQQIKALSQAQLFFKVGLPFEKALLKKIEALPIHPEIIDTQAGINLQPIQSLTSTGKRSLNHKHHQGHQHLSGLDPHSWLDPQLALKQAHTIYSAIAHIDPGGKSIYLNNLNILRRKLKHLHKELSEILKPFSGSTLFVYHPAFGYFARAYNMQQLAIEIEGKSPKAKDLAKFIKKARQKQAQVLFVQPQFDQQSAQKIAEILNCNVIPIDPLAINYCSNLNKISKTIRNHLEKVK